MRRLLKRPKNHLGENAFIIWPITQEKSKSSIFPQTDSNCVYPRWEFCYSPFFILQL